MENMKVISIAEDDLKNLMVLLDRVEYKGLKEVDAVNKILYTLRTAKPLETQMSEREVEEK